MSLQDLKYNEVRIRQGSNFQQIPNFVVAAEELADGQFVAYGEDGQYHKCISAQRATHLVKRAGRARNTIDEITDLTGIVQEGEPVMALTGMGTVTIPFASNVSPGDPLVVDDGYAVLYDQAYFGDAYIIGHATETVTLPEGETIAWGEAFINLPAQYHA